MTAEKPRQSDKKSGRVGRPPRPPSQLSPRVKCLTVADLTAAGFGSRSEIYRKVQANELPQPFKVGGVNLWREAAIIAWLDKVQPVKA